MCVCVCRKREIKICKYMYVVSSVILTLSDAFFMNMSMQSIPHYPLTITNNKQTFLEYILVILRRLLQNY